MTTKNNKNSASVLITILVILNLFVPIFFMWFIWPSIQCNIIESWKPIIYIYPTEDMDVSIKLSHPEDLTTTYPKYNYEWKVRALTDGTLIDENNKKYYALYWEEEKNHSVDFSEGFYVTNENAIEFLEEKLSINS